MKKYLKLSLFTIFIFLFSFLNVSAEENVELVSVKLQEKSEYVEINEEVSLDGNKIISNVNFFDEGDYVIYKFKIKNNDERDYKISDIFDDNESEYLDFQYTYDEFIGAKEEKEVLLKITYKSQLPYDAVLTPENEFNAVNEISISIELEEVLVNPSTFDNVSLYLILEVIGVIALLVIFIKLKKKNAILLLLLAVLLIPKNTNAKIEFKVNFTFKNTMNLKVNYFSRNWRSYISGTYNKIEFIKEKDYPEGAKDVSQEQNGSIMAWIDDGTLYFGSKYIIFLPKISYGLFAGVGVNEYNFNNRVDTTFVTNMNSLFSANSNVKEFDLRFFRMGNVTDMNLLFTGCANLETINLDGWDLSSITVNTTYFFAGSTKLKDVSLKNWILPEYFYAHLTAQSSAENVDVTGWNLSNNKSVSYLFTNSTELRSVIGINTWDTSNVKSMSQFFSKCQNLEFLNLDNLYISTKNDMYSFISECGIKELSAKNWKIVFEENNYFRLRDVVKDSALEKIDVTGWDLSEANSLYAYFEDYKDLNEIIGLDTWDTSSIENMDYLFYECGYNADELDISDIFDWDVSNVKSMNSMFYRFGYNNENIDLDFSKWDVSNVQNMSSMFEEIGYNSKSFNLIISDWENSHTTYFNYLFRNCGNNAEIVNLSINNLDFSAVTTASYMMNKVGYNSNKVKITLNNIKLASLENFDNIFYSLGEYAKNVEMNLSNFKLDSATKGEYAFEYVGAQSDKTSIKLNNWDTPSLVNATHMFNYVAYSTEELDLILSNVDVSNVTNMAYMFYTAGRDAEKFNIKLENFDTSSATDMKAMFAYVAHNSTKWKIDGLENFNFKNVTIIENFLDSYNITMRDLGTLDLYHINSNFLGNNNAIKLTINLHENPDTYANLFDSNTAKDSNSEIIINYTSNVNIDDIIDNVPTTSHIVKGVLIEE